MEAVKFIMICAIIYAFAQKWQLSFLNGNSFGKLRLRKSGNHASEPKPLRNGTNVDSSCPVFSIALKLVHIKLGHFTGNIMFH